MEASFDHGGKSRAPGGRYLGVDNLETDEEHSPEDRSARGRGEGFGTARRSTGADKSFRPGEADRFEDGGRARLWGGWCDVEHRQGGRARAWVAGHRLIIAGSDDAARERAIARFRRREVERVSRPLLDSWVAVMGVPRPAAVRYRAMRTRWGSCNHRTGAITLNTALVRFPVAALEYVVVHELAHLKHADHGQGFWSLVAAALPDHVERRKRLGTYTI